MKNINDITIKTIIDNTAAVPMVMAEWGLSIYIDTGDKKILFDTGAGNSDVLVNNMKVLDINPEEIDVVVLSHGHQDHTGGLRSFLKKMHFVSPEKKIDVICHPSAMEPQYVKNIGSFGCPYTVEELQRYGAVFKFVTEPYNITEDIFFSGEIPMINDYEETGDAFFRLEGSNWANGETIENNKILNFNDSDQKYVQDNYVIDDASIYIKTSKGLIIILGCAHRGFINTINHATEVTKMKNVYLVIGGTHTSGISDYRMKSSVEALKSLKVQKVGVSHCTGQIAGCKLSNELGEDIFFHNNAGSVIKFKNNKIDFNKF